MRIAIPVWNGRVSPVFDVAKTIRVTDIGGGHGEVDGSATHVLNPVRPVATLTELGVDVLVCSAVSAPLAAALSASNIEVISDICGPPDEIIASLATGDDALEAFRSPGSRRGSVRSVISRGPLGSR